MKKLNTQYQSALNLQNGTELIVHVTDDKKRFISFGNCLNALEQNIEDFYNTLQSEWLKPYLSPKLKRWINIELKEEMEYDRTSPIAFKFEADLLIDICIGYIQASGNKVIPKSKINIADNMFNIVSAFARLGMVSVVDEVTQYQDEREPDALQRMFK